MTTPPRRRPAADFSKAVQKPSPAAANRPNLVLPEGHEEDRSRHPIAPKATTQKRKPSAGGDKEETRILIGARVPQSLSKKLKVYSASHDVTQEKIVETALREFFAAHPNGLA